MFSDDSSDDGSDTDDDGGDEAVGQFNDALTADPRPPVRVGYRYKKGDMLMFKKQYFTVGIIGRLEALSLQHDRTGLVLEQTRERPNARTARAKGTFVYTVQFDDPTRTVPRLPARGDDGIDGDDDAHECL